MLNIVRPACPRTGDKPVRGRDASDLDRLTFVADGIRIIALLEKASVPFDSGAAPESWQTGTPLRGKAGDLSDSFDKCALKLLFCQFGGVL